MSTERILVILLATGLATECFMTGGIAKLAFFFVIYFVLGLIAMKIGSSK